MKLKNEYLSDKELEQLILDVEQHELVAAPPEILERVLDNIETIQGNSNHNLGQNKPSDNKVREFRSYCFRVLTSVAAAIMIVFLLPELLDTQLADVSTRQDIVAPRKYATKEEALNDKGILMRTLGGVTIFDNDNKLNIFSERDGG